MSAQDELSAVIERVIAVFLRLDISYLITGSFASSLHGEFRATNDLDCLAALDRRLVGALLQDLESDFIVDLNQATAALAEGTSFNLIHRGTLLKVDVFPARTAFDREALERAEPVELPGTTTRLRVATKEDILLAKLRWYRLGVEQSERQLRDIRSLVSLNREDLDRPYLTRWAEALGVADLLDRVLGA